MSCPNLKQANNSLEGKPQILATHKLAGIGLDGMNFKGSLNESTDDSTEEEDSSRGGYLNESDCGLKARAVIQEEIIKLANLIEEKLLSIQEELSQVEDLYNLECASNFLREVFIDGSL